MSFPKPSDGSPGHRLRGAEGILAAFGWLLLASLAPAADFPELRGPYLGQTPPKRGAEVFAPGILKPETGFHSSVVFDEDGDRACWTAMSAGRTFCSRRIDDQWSSPELLLFDPEYGVREPFFAHGDQRLYFLSRRPLPHDPVERERIWYVERTEAGWSDPRAIDDVVSAHPTHWQFSFTDSGDLYFTSEAPDVRGEQDIYVSRRRDGVFTEPESVGDGVNTDLREFCPFIAPDESYLIFSRTVPEERGRSDLFVSFRTPDSSSWTEAVNMGDAVNSLHNETSPIVTPDGRHLFFLRVSGDINDVFWTSAGIIEELRRSVRAVPVTEAALLSHIERFEREVDGRSGEDLRGLLQNQAEQYGGRRLRVSGATIASTYTRDNESNIYFGVTYDPDDHLYLRQINPSLHESLARHEHWVSVAKTYPSRQLSFELPIDRNTFDRLERGAAVDFTCRIAALIRGRSVYCAPAGLEIIDQPVGPAPR